MSTRSAHSSYW